MESQGAAVMTSMELEELLAALGEQLGAVGGEVVELVICGGSALNLLGIIQRATKDVDVVAIRTSDEAGPRYVTAKPLPRDVVEARDRVARDFGAPSDWLNDGPAGIMTRGLPSGFEERLTERRYGRRLILQLLGRYDLICLKLEALADTDVGSRHFQDLLALRPSEEELRGAADWTLLQNERDGFLPGLQGALRELGAENVASELG
jgi:hypothetical protein